jgi:hypothetical protein
VSKQVVGDGDGDGLADALGDGLGLGEAATATLSSQTFPVVVSWTGGNLGATEALGVTVGAGCLSWKNKTTAVTTKIPVKPIKPQSNHFLLVLGALVVVG